MTQAPAIPAFTLFGETGAFPDVIHCERIWDRARLHDWTISPHRHHDMAQLFMMRQGRAQVRLDDRALTLGDGGLLFVPARFVHGFRFDRGSEGLVLSFPQPVLTQAVSGPEDPGRALAQPFAGTTDGTVTALCGEIQSAFGAVAPLRASLLVALTQALLIAVARIAMQAGQGGLPLVRRRMADLDRLIQRHMGDGWGPAAYAKALAVTPGHLNRICRAALGVSASVHIEGATMTEARRLLAFTRLSVAEIGYRLGFGDPSYFSRRFRAATGQSPSAYRGGFGGAPD
ncbi:helix-turn-helix domain-containing protein [uncultured Paracoccus sp.]|uniref:helix-turn-helix domain-containing protein n=1 Tax=uncultured Paracoccus sp. TaxID=189685 RepID=UPI0025FF1831|nr:helix-turn-helix domain-containing protein [uncultured Paracoccus sp.]